MNGRPYSESLQATAGRVTEQDRPADARPTWARRGATEGGDAPPTAPAPTSTEAVTVRARPWPTEKSRADPLGRVLIIDDDVRVGAVLARELESYDVVLTETGREALEILEVDRDFDVVLCDMMMPEFSGMDVYDAATRLDSALGERFVFMTGGAFTSRAHAFLATHPAHLEKPFTGETLQAAVAAAAAHRRPHTHPTPPS
jgi:two-component system cell cycle sensor histidine kinase/response regulator CckA